MTAKKVKKKSEIIKSHTISLAIMELTAHRNKYNPAGAAIVENRNLDGISVFMDGANTDEVIQAMLTFIRGNQRHEADKIKDRANET